MRLSFRILCQIRAFLLLSGLFGWAHLLLKNASDLHTPISNPQQTHRRIQHCATRIVAISELES